MLEKFNSPYNPKETEERIYRLWEESGFFAPEAHQPRADNPNSKKTFTVVIPPPNVTGTLHMGHALNATIQDIVIRQKRMAGFKTLWLPGTDHAGIATQNVVEKQLKKEGLTRHQLGREKFLEKVWEWKEKYGNIILDQLKKLGASCDWSRTRFTMDEEYKKAVEEAFLHYHKKGLIYQGERVVNWCVRCQTSLSDLELEYEEEKGKLYFIKYPFKENPKSRIPNPKQIQNSKFKIQNYIIVATTRPETMLGDTAVAVNPKDERYENLIGKILVLPIQNREIPIVADESVDEDFGTGAVKVTPSHSLADAEIAGRHKLPEIKIINEIGKMTKEAGAEFEGENVKNAREKVVAKLAELGLLEKTDDYIHRVAKCYRCGAIIEPQPSKQWFLKMDELAKTAIKAVKDGKVKFSDERWEKIYSDWLSNIRDWCVSRQIWWGHQLPIYFCKNKSEEIKNEKLKIKNEENFVASVKKPEKCPFCGECEMEQSQDVLDTWFSSALWPFATLNWPNKESADLQQFYPTQFLSTARDIINLWVGRMVFSGLEFMGEAPFQDVFIHPTVLAKSGQRMSKSLGTGIDPLGLIEKYGADAARFGLIYQMMGNQDMKFDESHLLAGKKFCNKIWNATRFVTLQSNAPENYPQEIQQSDLINNQDKKIIDSLEKTKAEAGRLIDNFEFGQALHLLYDFFWHEFCDIYIEESKKQLNSKISGYILITSLKLLHPFMPFITEEIWGELPIKGKKPLIIESWPANSK